MRRRFLCLLNVRSSDPSTLRSFTFILRHVCVRYPVRVLFFFPRLKLMSVTLLFWVFQWKTRSMSSFSPFLHRQKIDNDNGIIGRWWYEAVVHRLHALYVRYENEKWRRRKYTSLGNSLCWCFYLFMSYGCFLRFLFLISTFVHLFKYIVNYFFIVKV